MNIEKFKNSRQIIFNEPEISKTRKENADGQMDFGIGFLDDALLGIQKNDLILIGAPSGAGKTELAAHIAFSNAVKGKEVVYFALEAEMNEIESRLVYKYKATEYFKNGGNRYTSYDLWICDGCEHLNEIKVPHEKFPTDTLRTRYVTSSYNINDFLLDYTEIVNSTDLVILDHIHYFDLESENENKEYKQIIKKIRSQVLEYGKPIVVVSHIKKRDRRFPVIAPDQEDFHGTSDLVKIATKVVSLSPQYETKIFKKISEEISTQVNETGFTFMKIAKNRRNGSVCRFIGATKYDYRTNAYHSKYFLGTQKTKDKELVYITETETPAWAKSAIT